MPSIKPVQQVFHRSPALMRTDSIRKMPLVPFGLSSNDKVAAYNGLIVLIFGDPSPATSGLRRRQSHFSPYFAKIS